MSIGQAFSDILTPYAQKALEGGCVVLIDSCFDALEVIKEPEDITETILVDHLPERYLYKYTSLFLKQFVVCIITVSWKLAQPTRIQPSSLAEELAAWAIINQAKVYAETDEEIAEVAIEDELEDLVDAYFEDLDFQYLFDDSYDGIDETQLAQMLGMSSLAFNACFVPFSYESSRTVHPYTHL